jgi:hypothetical protein
MRPVPHEQLVPPYDWLWAREPEEHLDEVVELVRALPGLDQASVIAGLTSKDDTTLDRFRRLGFEKVWRVEPREDLDISDPAANIETVQKLTTPETMARIAASRGRADVLFVRHIIEHTEDLHAFVGGLSELVEDGGYVVVEAPDCTRSLELFDYAMPWEEHSLYFTPATFEHVLQIGGFETVRSTNHPFPFENSMVVIARKSGAARVPEVSPGAAAQRRLLRTYADAFPQVTRALRRHLEHIRRDGGSIALFGAGHLACAFLNFHRLGDLVEFIVDDTPQKQGLFLPGTRLPILPSRSLTDRAVKLCLLAISPGSEDKVMGKHTAFLEAGGVFRSVLASSARSVRRDFIVEQGSTAGAWQG